MIKSKPAKDILHRLVKLMYGYNYQVTFGINIFDNCSNLKDFGKQLIACYPKTIPSGTKPISITAEEFWAEINDALDYRGDESAGLLLDQKSEVDLKAIQSKYKTFIGQYITGDAAIYIYPDDTGIPGYPVFWDFRFIVLTANNVCLFIYGSASD